MQRSASQTPAAGRWRASRKISHHACSTAWSASCLKAMRGPTRGPMILPLGPAMDNIEAMVLEAAKQEGLAPSMENLPEDGSMVMRVRGDDCERQADRIFRARESSSPKWTGPAARSCKSSIRAPAKRSGAVRLAEGSREPWAVAAQSQFERTPLWAREKSGHRGARQAASRCADILPASIIAQQRSHPQ